MGRVKRFFRSLYSFEPIPMRLDTQSISLGLGKVGTDNGEYSLFQIYWSWGSWHDIYIDLFWFEVFKYNGYKE